MKTAYQEFVTNISRKIEPKRVYTDILRRFAYGTDASFYRYVPQVVVRVNDESELCALLAEAAALSLPVTFRAAGTSLSGQASTDSILVLTNQNWERSEVLEGGAAIRTQVGVVGARLNEILKPYGVKIGPDPASVGSAMIGGIVANNASGMNGTRENSYQTLRSVRIILADGTLLDTGDHQSREAFLHSHTAFVGKIIELRDRIRADKHLSERIRKKYSIKNTTGLSINPFIDFDDPFDIIAHLMVGSEGSLAFISEVVLDTLPLVPFKASAMLYFDNITDACRAVQRLKPLPVDSAELLDRLSLRAVEDNDGIPSFIKDLPDGATAVLVETKAMTEEQLQQNIAAVRAAVAEFKTLRPIEFTDKAEEYSKFWRIRSGVFPSVGGLRKTGSSCLIEDVVFPLDVMPEAITELQSIIRQHGYQDGCIYGHSIEGNFHFIINQDFSEQSGVERFESLLESVVALVVDKYDASLKGEHGTGRNIAPYVEREWGAEAYAIMREVKQLFDPNNLLNRGVIFNDDKRCHISNLKRLTPTNPIVDKCIECGFCEVNCLSCGFTLSARQRTVLQREIARLRLTGEDASLLAELERGYRYFGEQTCAKDGLCSLSCPIKIDTGKLTQSLREQAAGATARRIARWSADHFAGIVSTLRFGLRVVDGVHWLIGSSAMSSLAKGARRLSGDTLPLWTPSMPQATAAPKVQYINADNPLKVVYFPSCINQVMGAAKGDASQEPLHKVFTRLLQRAGYEVIFPRNMSRLCCGTIWESKGFVKDADRKSAELEEALREASEGGKYPIVCDQSPCLYRMVKTIKSLRLYEPIEFVDKFLMDRLAFEPVDETIALHITCSMRKLGKEATLLRVAEACAKRVIIPEEVGCCGFAGDRGFNYPELNAYALRKLRANIEKHRATSGYSNSRTCEIGLTTHSGIPYQGLVYLIERCTSPKPQD